jgi:hypothetical protein
LGKYCFFHEAEGNGSKSVLEVASWCAGLLEELEAAFREKEAEGRRDDPE